MRFYAVDLTQARAEAIGTDFHPQRAKVPLQILEPDAATARDRAAHYLRRLHASSAPMEEWELITRDNAVLVRSGTMFVHRLRIVWRKA